MDNRSDDDDSVDSGPDPDVRFTYANERTFLAWNRTALVLVATGVAAAELLPKFAEPYGRRILALPLIALGAYVSIASYRQWRANQRAMRAGEALPTSHMPVILAAGIAIVAVVAVVLGAIGTS